LINSIILQEAKISSEIENIVTTHDNLYQSLATAEKKTDPNTKEVLHYSEALWCGYEWIKKKGFINTNSYIKIVNTIKKEVEGIRKLPGTKILNPATGKIIYTPPEGESIIRKKLKDLDDFINNKNDEIEPLVKLALIHYQFEAIHPFYDGNGRTGRIINILYLSLNDLLDRPILYLSKYIIENKKEYYKKIREVTEKNNWTEWVLFVLDAIEETAKYTETKINKICSLIEDYCLLVKKELPGIYSKELVEVIFRLPYCKRKFLVEAGIAKEKTAGRYLSELEKIGLLKSVKVGRERLYLNESFYKLLKN
jgi:Fic family protein